MEVGEVRDPGREILEEYDEETDAGQETERN